MELKANELRIGNLIYGVSDRIEKITSINNAFVKTNLLGIDAESQSIYLSHIQPIPLTEEWLLKFGFEETNAKENLDREWCVDYEIENCNFIINYNKTLNIFYFSFSNGINWINNEIYCIHQLQNLYFALTNKELEIKM